MPKPLNDSEIQERLHQVQKWTISEEGKLSRTFKLADFTAAFAFLSAVAIESEKRNHHPEIYNVYSTVRLELTTHDAGGITEKDFALAKAIDNRAPKPD